MKRPSELYIAALLGVIATLGRVYFPTEPVGAWVIRIVSGVYALAFLVRAFTAPPASPRPLRTRVGMGLGLLPLLVLLGLMTGYGFTIAYIFFRWTLAVLLLGAVIAVGVVAWHVRQGRLRGVVLQVLVVSLVFVSATCFGPLCMWMWAKPDLATCQQVAGQPGVTRLTPDIYLEQGSFPYDMAYIPSQQRIAGSFKMAGNLAIGMWDNPEANRLVVVDVTDQAHPVLGELHLEGDPLPQYMTIGPTEDELLVNRLGYERHLLDYIDLTNFPTLRLSQRVETVPLPHGMQRISDDQLLLATMRREVMLLDYASGEVQLSRPIHTFLATPGVTVTDLAVSPDAQTGYLSMFGTHIVAVDLSDGDLAMRSGPVGMGGGLVTHDPLLPRLYRTDFFQNVLHVMDSQTLEIVRETPLSFTPRPTAVAPKRDLVAIGAWIEGVVHFMKRSDGAPIDVTIPVGPYLRKLAIDDERGLLFAGTKCGIVMVDLETFGL
ncbi:MAG: hypothetical protein QF464_00435 [Myxococcota bacterium]|jgi:hypothetical protein|nr:hypothetical protein [Myxococcota bacterium]